MKQVLFMIAICIGIAFQANASIIPTESLVIIDNDKVEFVLNSAVQENIFEQADYSNSDNSFNFVTHEITEYIQIYGQDGQMIFQLPVLSNKIRINKSLFDKGEYRLGFMFEGYSKMEFTSVKVK